MEMNFKKGHTVMKKPRTIRNKSVNLSCQQDDKGKRSIEIDIRHEAMTPLQASTVRGSLDEMIAWCEAKA
uniref:Uncharacterized protein n=1 Tax=viral metagenome TaxID=1070528 RepID=A0A6M3LEM9_9ZZZZ